MDKVFIVFIVAFFAVAILGLVISILLGKEAVLSRNCRSSALIAFGIGLLLLYLRYVFV